MHIKTKQNEQGAANIPRYSEKNYESHNTHFHLLLLVLIITIIPSIICWIDASSSSCCRCVLAISSSLPASCIAAAVFTSSTSACNFFTCPANSDRSPSAFASFSRVQLSSSGQPITQGKPAAIFRENSRQRAVEPFAVFRENFHSTNCYMPRTFPAWDSCPSTFAKITRVWQ